MDFGAKDRGDRSQAGLRARLKKRFDPPSECKLESAVPLADLGYASWKVIGQILRIEAKHLKADTLLGLPLSWGTSH